MKGYTTREVSKILGLTDRQVRAYAAAGLVEPDRGARGVLLFSFEDLVFLRAARGLFAARIPVRRLRRALSKLRDQLPRGRRLTGVRIAVEGKRIVAGDGAARWQPESGQILFDFGVEELARKAAPLARRAFRQAEQERGESLSAEEWFRWGCELEPTAPQEAREAYERALALDSRHADAQVNLGRLLHESGDASGAERHYRAALAARSTHATAAFNLGVALEDLGRSGEALEPTKMPRARSGERRRPLQRRDPLRTAGRLPDALRHLKSYRTLTRDRSR